MNDARHGLCFHLFRGPPVTGRLEMINMIVKAAISWLMTLPSIDVTGVVDAIVEAMTGNANFNKPTPTLAEVTTANDAAKKAIADAASGGRPLTAIKIAQMDALGAVIRPLASFVTIAANGDMAKLLS